MLHALIQVFSTLCWIQVFSTLCRTGGVQYFVLCTCVQYVVLCKGVQYCYYICSVKKVFNTLCHVQRCSVPTLCCVQRFLVPCIVDRVVQYAMLCIEVFSTLDCLQVFSTVCWVEDVFSTLCALDVLLCGCAGSVHSSAFVLCTGCSAFCVRYMICYFVFCSSSTWYVLLCVVHRKCPAFMYRVFSILCQVHDLFSNLHFVVLSTWDILLCAVYRKCSAFVLCTGCLAFCVRYMICWIYCIL